MKREDVVVLEVAEVFRGPVHLARVVLELPIEGLPEILGACELGRLAEHPNTRAALESAARAKDERRRAAPERERDAAPPAPAEPPPLAVDEHDRVRVARAPRHPR